MNSAIERLLNLRVGDVMTRSVVQIPAHQTMGAAAQLMIDHEISGAPVVDEEGRCAGILSGFDFAARERIGCKREEVPRGNAEHVLVCDVPGQPYHIEDFSEDMVSNHMSSAVQTINPSAALLQAARIMCAEHIHRLVVLDEHRHPLGIVSSLDIIAALVKVIGE